MAKKKQQSKQKASPQQSKKKKEFSFENLPKWLPFAVFAVTTLIYFLPQITGSAWFWDDFLEQAYTRYSFAAYHLSNFSIPYWDPFTYSGIPFIAQTQTAYFYPANWLLALFVEDKHVPAYILQFLQILHFFAAQVGMYYLLRNYKRSIPASLFGGIAYGFCAFMSLQLIHVTFIQHAAWLPFVILTLDRFLNVPNLKRALTAGLILGLSLFPGHPQFLFYFVIFAGVYTAWYLFGHLIKKEIVTKQLPKYLGYSAIVFAIAVMLFSVQLFHSQELADLSQREEITYEFAAGSSLQAKQVFSAVAPKMFGYVLEDRNDIEIPFYISGYYDYWETSFYFGIPVLVLGIIGFWVLRKSLLGQFLLISAAVSFLYALGSNGFLFGILFELPFFNLFRAPGRVMYFFTFTIIIASAYGFDYLFSKRESIPKELLYITAGLPVLIALGVISGIIPGLVETPEQILSAVKSSGMVPLLFAVITGIVVLFAFQKKISLINGSVFLIVILFADLYVFGNEFKNGSTNPEKAFEIPVEVEKVFSIKPPDEVFRVRSRIYDPPYMALKRNQGPLSSIMLLEGYHSLFLATRTVPHPGIEISSKLLNIKYSVDVQNNRPRFVEFPERWGHVRIYYNYVVMEDSVSQKVMKSGNIDFDNVIILSKNPELKYSYAKHDSVSHKVKLTGYSENKINVDVETPENGILWLSELYYPSWKAYINGEKKETIKVFNSMRGIEIPAGNHSVKLVYESEAFNKGKWLSLITLILVIAGLVYTSRSKKTEDE